MNVKQCSTFWVQREAMNHQPLLPLRTHAEPSRRWASFLVVIKKLSPCVPGAQKLHYRYGDELVRVRQRITADGNGLCTIVNCCRGRPSYVVAKTQRWVSRLHLRKNIRDTALVQQTPNARRWTKQLDYACCLGLTDRVRRRNP